MLYSHVRAFQSLKVRWSFRSWLAVVFWLHPGHYSSLTAPNLQHTATKNETTNVVINIIVASS